MDHVKRFFDRARSRELVFLLAGRTGTGKSSTINSLLGEKVAETGDYEPTTPSVTSYKTVINDAHVTVIDTPGLCDDLPEKGNDDFYLNLIASQHLHLNCLWFVTNLDAPRITCDEKRAIRLLTDAFGAKVWEQTIIVFTFADKVPPGKFEEA